MNAKKVVITDLGGPEVIQIENFEVIDPENSEIRVKVDYAGLAYADLMLRKMNMPGLPEKPFTPGADISGTVDKVGSEVKNFKKGDRVVGLLMSDFGGQSQYININKTNLFKVPDDIPLDKAVCMMVNYLTAYQLLKKSNCLSSLNSSVLIHGGNGGVGSALIQIAKSYGLKVIATSSNIKSVSEMGAIGIDYTKDNFLDVISQRYEKVDYIFDPIGDDYLKKSVKILNRNGTYIGYGFQSALNKGMSGIMKSILRFSVKKLFSPGKRLISFQLKDKAQEEYAKDIDELFNLYRNGKIDPIISEIIDIDEARLAHEKLEKGDKKGKILIKAV